VFFYRQGTGELFDEDTLISTGYSGHGEGKNNTEMQDRHDVGPLPCGVWTMHRAEHVDAPGPHGPFTLRLTPNEGTDTFGRDSFLCHGDSKEHPGDASLGCMIQARKIRERLDAAVEAGDDQLTVTAE
jgi:hypothetical protein